MIAMTPRTTSLLFALGLCGLLNRCISGSPDPSTGQTPLVITTTPDLSVSSSISPSHGGRGSDLAANPAACKLSSNHAHYLNEGFDTDPFSAYLPSRGTLNATMIFVDFEDAPASEDTADLYQHFMPAAAEWYQDASFGRLDLQVTADFSQFYRMPHNSSTYDYNRGMRYEGHRRYIQDALDVVGRNISFDSTDLLYIVPTKEAKEISYSPTFMNAIKATDGSVINKTVTFGQDMYWFGHKVMNHETGHTMGLPDTYSYGPHTRAGIFVGGYDLMAQIEGISPDYLAWHKWRLGWIDDDQVVCLASDIATFKTRKYVLTPIEEASGLKAIIYRYNATFAVVAEHRSGKGLNTNTCGSGILIYTVHTLVPTGQGPIRVQDSSPESEGCAGGKLNDALFIPKHHHRSSFLGWGVNITVIEEMLAGFAVEINCS